jgi:hypothetical protein
VVVTLNKEISPGLIKMLQKYACDPADEKRWNKINAFLERDLEAEDRDHASPSLILN